MNGKKVTVFIPEILEREMKKHMEASGQNKSEFIRNAIRNFLRMN